MLPLPHSASVSKREVTPEDLLRLYSLCACRDPATQSGSYPRRSHWRHWTQPAGGCPEPSAALSGTRREGPQGSGGCSAKTWEDTRRSRPVNCKRSPVTRHPPCVAADEEVLQKLRMALHNSVAIAAAFTRDPRITDDYASDDDDYPTGGSSRSDTGSEASASSGGSGSGGGLWTFGGGGEGALAGWPAPLRELGSSLFGQRRPPRLVGFARAAGDYSLVSGRRWWPVRCARRRFVVAARGWKGARFWESECLI